MEVIVTRSYVSWSNFWCCCSLSKVVVLSRITTINRSTVLSFSSNSIFNIVHRRLRNMLQSNILDLCSRTRGLRGNTPSKATHTDSLFYSSQGDVHYVRSSSRVSVALVPILQSSYTIASRAGSGGWVVRGKYRCRRVWT